MFLCYFGGLKFSSVLFSSRLFHVWITSTWSIQHRTAQDKPCNAHNDEGEKTIAHLCLQIHGSELYWSCTCYLEGLMWSPWRWVWGKKSLQKNKYNNQTNKISQSLVFFYITFELPAPHPSPKSLFQNTNFSCKKLILLSLFCPIFLRHWKENDEFARGNRSKVTASLGKTLYTTDIFYSPSEVRPKIFSVNLYEYF